MVTHPSLQQAKGCPNIVSLQFLDGLYVSEKGNIEQES
jgi:hypothetical protein